MKRSTRALSLFVAGSLVWLEGSPPILDAAPPSNFLVQDILTQIDQPMSIRFLPDGRMLLLEKKGKVRILQVSGSPIQQDVYLDLAAATHASGIMADQERGLIDVAVDPNFPTEPYIYLFYTPATGPDGAKARIARFTHNQKSGGVLSRGDPSSEVILWQDTQGYDSCCHFGGGLDFGPDGNLWLATGDHFQGSYAASLQHAGGKVIRIAKNGSIPAGNPFNDGAGPNVDSLFAYGLRNPFRARWDLPSGRFFIAEVGGNTQSIACEDLHVIRYSQATSRFIDSDFGTPADNGIFNGINFGWPNCEGQSPYINFTACNIDATGEPIFSYAHAGNTAAINGGIVYRGTQFPSAYQGVYFYADSTRDFIRYLKFNPNGSVATNPAPGSISSTNPDRVSYPFDPDPIGRIVSLDLGPDGALYYVSFTDSGGAFGEPNPSVLGSVRRYVYSAGNVGPVVTQFAAQPKEGDAPLTVGFTVDASDPDSSTMNYVLFFGDGDSTGTPLPLVNGSPVAVTHTYQAQGAYEAVLEVSDGSLTTTSTLIVKVGNPPTITSIVAGTSRAGWIPNQFRYGDTLLFTATASDTEDGSMGAANFTWAVDFIRPGNVHPVLGPVTGTTALEFPIPAQGQGFSGPVFYRCFLTVIDSSGLTTSTNLDVYPEKSNVTFTSVPTGIQVQVDGNTAQPTPFVLDSLINFQHTVSVPSQQCNGGQQYQFTNWSNGGIAPSQIFVVPELDSALGATYTGTGPCNYSNLLVTAGLVVQLESDLNVALQTGSTVAGWLDQSGLGNDLVAGGAPVLISVATPAGRPAIRFNGLDDKLQRIHSTSPLGGLPMANANRSMFLVAKYTGSQAWGGLAYGTGAANQSFGLVVKVSTGELVLQGWGGGNDLVSTTPGIGAGWLLQSAILNGGLATLHKNGAPIAQWSKTYATTPTKLVIGQEIASLGYTAMEAAAVLIYNRALSTEERNNVETYLEQKYLTANTNSNSSPSITINVPTNGASFVAGTTITFTGTAIDAEDDDTVLSTNIGWSSDRDGVLGTNKTISVSTLSVGAHQVTAMVKDSGGITASAVLNLSVTTSTASGPPSSASLVLWLESTEGVGFNANTVTSWADLSGKTNTLTAGGNPVLVTAATPKGQPAIRFDGINDKLERFQSAGLNGFPALNQDRSVFMVAKYNASQAWGGFSYGTGSANQAFGLVVQHPSGQFVLQGWGSGNDLISTAAGIGAGWLSQSAVLNAGNATLYKNGQPVAQWTKNYNTILNKVVIGQEIAGLGYMNMDVAAVLIYDRALSTEERANVETYLEQKYLSGIAPSNSPPSITINSPTHGATFPKGTTITFSAMATDVEDGNVALGSRVRWNSDRDGSLGTNSTISVTTLSTGTHLITAAVTDSGGMTASAVINIRSRK